MGLPIGWKYQCEACGPCTSLVFVIDKLTLCVQFRLGLFGLFESGHLQRLPRSEKQTVAAGTSTQLEVYQQACGLWSVT